MFKKFVACFTGNNKNNKNTIQKFIGKGSYGTIVSTYDGNGQKVAVKHAHSDVYSKSLLLKEYRMLKMLDHPNIVKPIRLHVEEITSVILPYFDAGVYMVLPYYKTDLLDFVNDNGNLNEHEVKLFIKAIASALKHAHDNNIVHLDIKPDNILLMNHDISECVLSDWGASNFVHDIKPSIVCGSEGYCAPELYSNIMNKTKNSIGKPADVYSLGVTVHVLMTSKRISDATQDIENLQCSDSLKNLLSGMLEIEPEKRMTIDDVLSHSFVQNV